MTHTDLTPSNRDALVVPDAVAERLTSAYTASMSPSTRKSYSTAWRTWMEWAERHGAPVLPALPEAVATFLAARAEGGASVSTLRIALSAISAAHDAQGYVSPTKDRIVRKAMQGLARQAAEAGATAQQAQGLTAEAVAAIRGAFKARFDGERTATAAKRDARDMALIAVMADAGLRRAEAAALTWADVRREDDGSGRVTIRRSKTDQEGAGAVVALTPAAMADLDRLAGFTGREPASAIFRASGRTIARRIAAAAEAAGLGDGFSGHSGRVGMAQRMTRNGAPAAAVMRQGRWKNPAMVARYIRNESAAEALKYL